MQFCKNCGGSIVESTFLDLGFWEPDYDPNSDPKIWRHESNGYAACIMIQTFAEPKND